MVFLRCVVTRPRWRAVIAPVCRNPDRSAQDSFREPSRRGFRAGQVTDWSPIVSSVETEDVFKALADSGRRALLDSLFVNDGQRLIELCEVLPELTRFGVMKHLTVLESAGLVVTQKVGRDKRHYLNPIPIQQVHDRWISKYAQPFTRAMTGLQRHLENRQQEDIA